MKRNNFGIFKPYYLLTPEAAIQNMPPKEVLINQGSIIMTDLENIEGQKQSALSQTPQAVIIERPAGYVRAFLSSPLLSVVFIKPTDKTIFPSNTNDLNAE
jgi:hypothetical protein